MMITTHVSVPLSLCLSVSRFLCPSVSRFLCSSVPLFLFPSQVLYSRLMREFDLVKVDDVPDMDYSQLVVPPKRPCRVRLVPRAAKA